MHRLLAATIGTLLALSAASALAQEDTIRLAFTQRGDKIRAVPLKRPAPLNRKSSWREPRQGNIVYVMTDTSVSMQNAVKMLKSPAYTRELAQSSYGPAGQQEFSNACRIRSTFEQVLQKGYKLFIVDQATPQEVVGAVGNPRTAAVFHEGHSAIMPAAKSKSGKDEVYLLFHDEKGERYGLSSRFVKPGYRASANLRFFSTNACQAAKSEMMYRDMLKLSPKTQWIAGWEDQRPADIAERFKEGGVVARQIKALPDLNAARMNKRRGR